MPLPAIPMLLGASLAATPDACAIEAEWRRCWADAGNKMDYLVCHRPALAQARELLVAQLDELHRDNATDRPGLDAAIDAAHRAWWRSIDADCGAVSQEWAGGSLRDAVVSSCYVEHTLARIRWLRSWHMHEDEQDCPRP